MKISKEVTSLNYPSVCIIYLHIFTVLVSTCIAFCQRIFKFLWHRALHKKGMSLLKGIHKFIKWFC